jgi:hypothetical protein
MVIYSGMVGYITLRHFTPSGALQSIQIRKWYWDSFRGQNAPERLKMKNREQAASPPIHLNQKLTMQKAKYKVTMA